LPHFAKSPFVRRRWCCGRYFRHGP